MEKYSIISTLGDGAFGTVYKAANSKTGEIVAIKKMKKKYQNWNECIQLAEIKSLRKFNHGNLVKLKEVVLTVTQELCMVFEYLEYNLYEIYSKMKNDHKKFTERQIKNMCFQVLNGLAHMHKNGFFHRDMKPQNILIYNNSVKICDMGLAREIRSRPPFSDYVSTRWYRAPELLLRSTSYNFPVDIFAFGCIMAQLYNQCPLFAGTNEIDQMNKIVKILGTPKKEDWPQGYKLAQSKGYHFPKESGIDLAKIIPDASVEAIELIESILKYRPCQRPSANQLLKHSFFAGVNIQIQESMKESEIQLKPTGKKLNTQKEDKRMDVFRQTKEKFKQTRKSEAIEGSFFKPFDKQDRTEKAEKHARQERFQKIDKNEKMEKNLKTEGSDDIDNILKELEEKSRKKSSKLPFVNTKDRLYKKEKDLRESKTMMKPDEPYNIMEREEWKHAKQEDYKKKKADEYKSHEIEDCKKADYQKYFKIEDWKSQKADNLKNLNSKDQRADAWKNPKAKNQKVEDWKYRKADSWKIPKPSYSMPETQKQLIKSEEKHNLYFYKAQELKGNQKVQTKKEPANMFSYSFQPALNPAFNSQAKGVVRPLGYLPIQKKGNLISLNSFKF